MLADQIRRRDATGSSGVRSRLSISVPGEYVQKLPQRVLNSSVPFVVVEDWRFSRQMTALRSIRVPPVQFLQEYGRIFVISILMDQEIIGRGDKI